MSVKTILVVLLSLAFGLIAAVGAARFVQGGVRTGDTVEVVITKIDVPRFTTLTAEHVTVQKYPKDLVPPGAVTNIEGTVGRVVETTLVKGEPVLESKLAPPGAGRGMAAVIPPGMRAVTITTPNVAAGVAGFILPGNKVDVLFTRKTHGQNDPFGGGVTQTLHQNVEILAVDQRIDAPSNNKVDTKELKSVTLLMSPEQSAEVDLAQTMGTLHLTLRNPLDKDAALTPPATMKWIEYGRNAVVADSLMNHAIGIGAGVTEAIKPAPPVAVAPPPVEVVKPEAPQPPPRIRTLRAGIPGSVFIE